MSPSDAAWRLLKNIDEVQLCPSCQGVGFSGNNDFSDEPKCMTCFGTGLAGGERYHPEEAESPDTRDWRYVKDEEIGNTMEKPYVNPYDDDEGEHFSLHRDVRGYLDSRPQPIKMRTLQGEPTFMYTPFAGVGRKMKNPAAEIFRRGEPMDLAWRLLKSFGYAFQPDDDDDENFKEEFMAHLREFVKNRSEDEQYTNHILDAGPHWTLDDRQKRVVEAALNVPLTHPNHHLGLSNYMREESHDMFGHFSHLFQHDSFQIPDHEYDRAIAIINNYAKEIDAHMSDPNADMSMEFLDDINNPEHPWTKAVEGYDGPLPIEADDWQTKNASEPMDLAMRLLKNEPADYADTYHQVRNNIGADGEFMTDEELNAINERYSELHDDESHLEEYYNLLEAIELEKKRRAEGSFDGIGYNEETGFTRSEPMDIAMRLLKLELEPPMTQGVEEQVPMQEDIPMVDMTMGDYESPCECAERIRSEVLGMILQEIEKPNISQSDIDSLRNSHQEWQGHACQEILEWAEGSPYWSKYCNNYMSEADQMKYTGEPMDLAWRLLKEEGRMTEAQRANIESRVKRRDEATRQHLDNEIEMERAGGLEGWRRDVLREIEENPYQYRRRGRVGLEGGAQTRLPGFREHFITSARQRGNEGVGHPIALKPTMGVIDNKENRFESDERQRLALLPKRAASRVQPSRLHMKLDNEHTTRDFQLKDEAGNVLSQIEDIGRYKLPGKDVDLIDRVPVHNHDAGRLAHYGGYSNIKRQGYYRDLLESILRHGFRVTSDDRNDQSNPFHRKFLRTIPDDIIGSTEDGTNKPGRWDRIDYKGKAPFSRTKDLDYGDLAVETRSKYPITYDTPWVAHQKVLDEGVSPNRDIIVPTHVDREGNVVEPKRYFQSRLAGMPVKNNQWGERIEPFAGQETTTTKEGLVIPKKFKSQYFQPHLQSGGTLGAGRGDGRWGKKLVTEPQPSAQALMNFGIDPMTRARQQVGVVDSGGPRPDASESEKQLNARASLAAQLMG